MTSCSDPLCVSRAHQLDRLLSTSEPGMVPALRMRIAELEEIVQRINRTAPNRDAVALCEELELIDPRDTGSLACFYCCQSDGHDKGCIYKRAERIAAWARADRKKNGSAA